MRAVLAIVLAVVGAGLVVVAPVVSLCLFALAYGCARRVPYETEAKITAFLFLAALAGIFATAMGW